MDVSASSEHAVHRVHAMLSSSSDTQWYPHFSWNFSSTPQPVETEQRSSSAFSSAAAGRDGATISAAQRYCANQHGGKPPASNPFAREQRACEGLSLSGCFSGCPILFDPVPCLLTPGLHASSVRPTPRVGRTSVYCQPPHHSTLRVSDVRVHICIVRPTLRVVHDVETTIVLPTPRVGYVVTDAHSSRCHA